MTIADNNQASISKKLCEIFLSLAFCLGEVTMATMTVSLPDPMKEWIEAQISKGDYASVSDYVRDLVRRDRDRRDHVLTRDELRAKLAASLDSGLSVRSVDDIFAEALQLAKGRDVTDG